MASERSSLSLRPASAADEGWLRRLRNDAEVRAASRSAAAVSEDEHAAWLEGVLADPDRRLLVCELGGVPIGQVRFDRLRGQRFEISVSLAPEARGRGLSSRLIVLAVSHLRESSPDATVEAHVRPGNRRSLAAFRAAGFRQGSEPPQDGFQTLVMSAE